MSLNSVSLNQNRILDARDNDKMTMCEDIGNIYSALRFLKPITSWVSIIGIRLLYQLYRLLSQYLFLDSYQGVQYK